MQHALNRSVDLLIVGAGPAGMSAAVQAAELGLTSVTLDEHAAAGGQVFRNVLRASEQTTRSALLGPQYARGAALAREFLACGDDFRPRSTVFDLSEDGVVSVLGAESGAYVLTARHVLLATGAYERPVPIPGWTLPGVMTAGAAQTALKAGGQIPSGRVVLAGSGPLLWLCAWQLQRAGADVRAVLSSTSPSAYLGALPALARALRAPLHASSELGKGLRWIGALHAAGVEVRHGIRSVAAQGDQCLRVVRYEQGGGVNRIDAAHLLLHEGVIPNVQASLALRLDHVWDRRQRCFKPAVDVWGASSSERIFVAGDGAGIAGAEAAQRGGVLAVLEVAHRQGRITRVERDKRAAALLGAQQRGEGLRRFLETLYADDGISAPPREPDGVVCRCENVTVGEIERAIATGAGGPRQVKAFTRAGMGMCQGRHCAPVVAAILAARLGCTHEEIDPPSCRAPLKPVQLGELADMALDQEFAMRGPAGALGPDVGRDAH